VTLLTAPVYRRSERVIRVVARNASRRDRVVTVVT